MNTPVAVVTGAGGTIGRAIGDALANDFAVVGLDQAESSASFPILSADVRDRARIDEVARTITADHGQVRIVVNNAGVLTMNPFLELTDDEWHRVFEINVFGTFAVSQIFARQMDVTGGGRIINVASIAGKTPLENQAHYCASKAAVMMLTQVMALELADANVRVFSICPGAVDTDLFRACLAWTAKREHRNSDEVLNEWLKPSRLGRLIEPTEIAALVHYLASGPSDALTGHAISIDGGIAPY
jgi:meso-butanediol dehydrogenase/(S,S)-butanediol dehydrogenase/diacetyl reductase